MPCMLKFPPQKLLSGRLAGCVPQSTVRTSRRLLSASAAAVSTGLLACAARPAAKPLPPPASMRNAEKAACTKAQSS